MGKELTNYSAAWAEKAKEMSSRFKPAAGGKTIGTAGGIFKVDDEPIPGNSLCAVILEAGYINAFYEGQWQPGEVTPPTCFAMSLDDKNMSPHPAMESDAFFKPQAASCSTCAFNEFGSAGKGKACKNRIRLALIPAGEFHKVPGTRNEWRPDIFEEEGHYKEAEMVYLSVPPTSIKAFKKYVAKCETDYARPLYGLITRIDIASVGTGGFSLEFETLEQFPDEYISTLSERHEEATGAVLQPFRAPENDTPAPGAARSRLAGLRKR